MWDRQSGRATALPGPGPIATEDARPTNREGQGFLRTVRRTIGDGIWRIRRHEVGKPHSLSSETAERVGRNRGKQPERGGIHDRPSLRSLRAASMARCAGTSGVVASYRRDPLVELHQEGRGLVTTFSTASRARRARALTVDFVPAVADGSCHRAVTLSVDACDTNLRELRQ
jgi:hypothetical protein